MLKGGTHTKYISAGADRIVYIEESGVAIFQLKVRIELSDGRTRGPADPHKKTHTHRHRLTMESKDKETRAYLNATLPTAS